MKMMDYLKIKKIVYMGYIITKHKMNSFYIIIAVLLSI